jgi:hypothetical protein
LTLRRWKEREPAPARPVSAGLRGVLLALARFSVVCSGQILMCSLETEMLTRSILALVGAVGIATQAHAIVAGTIDTFGDGTLQNWGGGDTLGSLSGGPGGGGDLFLNVATNAGGGAGSHLATFNNDARWTGNYIGAGLTSIDADMENVGLTTLQMRLVIFDNGGNRWTSASALTIAPGSGWRHFSFPVTAGSLIEVSGAATYASSLSGVSRLMFRHDAVGNSTGQVINGKIGIDNIAAVPTPAVSVLLGVAGVFAGRRRR